MRRQAEDSRMHEALPRARIRRSFFQWAIWVFPVAAVIFLGVLIYRDQLDKARQITVLFKNADGVEPDNTMLKCRGATVGTVKKVFLTPDHEWVSLKINLVRGQESIAREGAVFWVVKAELGAGTVTGLQTVMSGSYLEVRPGSGNRTNQFIGAAEAPADQMAESDFLRIGFLAPSLNSIQESSPIFYRGIQVGKVVDFQLATDAQHVIIHAEIRKPYAPLVRMNSVFWNAGGIDVHFGLLRGLNVSAESARALVAGAIEFATPDDYQGPATEGTAFQLYDKPDDKWKTWHPNIALRLPAEAAPGAPYSAPNLPPTSFQK